MKMEDLANVRNEFIKCIQYALHELGDQKYMWPEKLECLNIGFDIEKDWTIGFFESPALPSIYFHCIKENFGKGNYRIIISGGERRYDKRYWIAPFMLKEVDDYEY